MRIQILPLPSVVVGDDVEEPFALIVDRHDSDMDEQTAEEWQRFKTNAGARALLITPDTVEVVDRYAETDTPEIARLTAYLKTHFPHEIDGVEHGEQSPVDLTTRLLHRELTRRHEEARKKAVAAEREAVAANSPQGDAARRALGIAGSMFVAELVPHGYNDSEGAAGHCIVCGLGRLARVHGEKL